MPIVSSSFKLDVVQPNGWRYCTEKHTDSNGNIIAVEYASPQDADNAAIMAARVPMLNDALKNDELYKMVFEYPWDHKRTECTTAELGAYVRELYRSSTGETLAKISSRILEWVNNGRYSDTNIAIVLGMTADEWGRFKTNMAALKTDFDAVQSAVGE